MIYIYDLVPYIEKKMIGRYCDGFIADQVTYRLWDSNYQISTFLKDECCLVSVIDEQFAKLNKVNTQSLKTNIQHSCITTLKYASKQYQEGESLGERLNYKQLKDLNALLLKYLKEEDIIIFNTKDFNINSNELLWIANELNQLNNVKIGYFNPEHQSVIDYCCCNILVCDGDEQTVEDYFNRHHQVHIIIGIVNGRHLIVKVKKQYYQVFSTLHQHGNINVESILASLAKSVENNTNIHTMLCTSLASGIVAGSTNDDTVDETLVEQVMDTIQITEMKERT